MMGRFLSTCGIICVFLILWTEKIQCPIVNTQPESNLCVLPTPKGFAIQASLKPSLNAKDNLPQNLDLSNARCCFNPDKKCALTEHLNVTLNNITSLLKYPIYPLGMVVNNKRIPRFGVWDELWYSFYEIGKPSLTQTVDVQIIRKTTFNSKETFSVHLRLDKSVSPTTQTERGPSDYLVLNQSLFDFPNSDCFNEKTRFLSLVHRQHRPCVEASSVDLEKQPYDFYVKGKVKEIRNEPTEFFLSSFGTLHDTAATSHHRSSVIFISQQPLILHIFIPNEEPSSRSTAFRFLSIPFVTISQYPGHLESFFKDQFTLATDIIYDGCDTIARYLKLLTTFLKGQWSFAVGVFYSGADQLCDLLGSFDKFDRISSEKSIDYQWNLIWSYVEHACQEIRALRDYEDIPMATGWIAFFVLSGFPVLLLIWLVATLRNTEIEDIIMLNDDNEAGCNGNCIPELCRGMCLKTGETVPVTDDTIVESNNTAHVRQETDQRSSYISLTPSDVRLDLQIAYDDAVRMGLQPSVSDPGINFDIENARFNSFREVCSVIRCMSDCGVMYLGQRLPEIRSVGTSRDFFTSTINHEYYRPPPRRCFSDPCINSLIAINEYDYDGDNDLVDIIGSSYDLMSVSHRETKNRISFRNCPEWPQKPSNLRKVFGKDPRFTAPSSHLRRSRLKASLAIPDTKMHPQLKTAVLAFYCGCLCPCRSLVEGPPTGTLTTVLKHPREEACEGVGTDLDEAYKLHMAQNGGVRKVSEEEYKLDEGVRQSLKILINDVDKDYGNNTTLVEEEPSRRDEGTDLDEAFKNNKDKSGGPVGVSQEDKDSQQAQNTDEMYDIDRTRRRRVINFLWQCQEVMFYVSRIYMDNRFY